MIKNIILDIGGVIVEDSSKKYKDEKYREKLNMSYDEIKNLGKIAFGGTFRDCLLGEMDIMEHISNVIRDNPSYKDELEYMLDPKFYNETYPIIPDRLDYVRTLKDRGYKIYFLSNINAESYNFIKHALDEFDGGVYSYQEHVKKPSKEIFERIIDKYNLNIDECVFFDDTIKNVDASNEFGLKSYLFNDINDIEDVL